MTGHHATRLWLGSLLILGVAGVVALDARLAHAPGTRLVVAALAAAALWECYVLFETLGARPDRAAGCAAAALLTAVPEFPGALAAWVGGAPGAWERFPSVAATDPARVGFAREGLHLIGFAGLAALAAWLPTGTRRSARDRAATAAGILYVALPLGFLPLLHRLDPGRDATSLPRLALLTVAACKGCDIAAYFVGTRWGRHRLAPRVSPKKTWEGAAGGMAGSMAAALLGAWLLPEEVLSGVQAVVLGTAIGIAAQAGDLSESWLKRRAGVKDSGALLPAFGGALDVADSLLGAAPVAYYVLRSF